MNGVGSRRQEILIAKQAVDRAQIALANAQRNYNRRRQLVQEGAISQQEADDAQREAIRTLARGEVGGPWAIFINTFDLDGPHPVPYEIEVDGERSSYRIGSAAELQMAGPRHARGV